MNAAAVERLGIYEQYFKFSVFPQQILSQPKYIAYDVTHVCICYENLLVFLLIYIHDVFITFV